MRQLELDISGMNCGHCIARVTKALEAVPGVKIESVAIGSARVAFDPAVTTPEKVSAAVTESGYDTRIGDAAA